jgi:hypothetical protein
MSAIAERRSQGLLAIAEPQLCGPLKRELFGGKTAAFMGAIAERLMAGESTGTPPVVACCEFHGTGLDIVDFGEGHRKEPLGIRVLLHLNIPK